MSTKTDRLVTQERLITAQAHYITTLEQIQARQDALITTLQQDLEDAEQRVVNFTARLKALESLTN